MTDEFADDDSLPLRELHRLLGGACVDCGTAYTAHDAVGSIALGFRNAPRCHACLSRRLGRDPGELRRQLVEYVHRRECFLRAWREADRMEGDGGNLTPRPPSLRGKGEEESVPPPLLGEGPGEGLPRESHWDAGELACGELVMQLRIRLNNLPPGSVLHIVARDPAAPEDLPAWCRLCGHALVSAAHPDYRVRRKEP